MHPNNNIHNFTQNNYIIDELHKIHYERVLAALSNYNYTLTIPLGSVLFRVGLVVFLLKTISIMVSPIYLAIYFLLILGRYNKFKNGEIVILNGDCSLKDFKKVFSSNLLIITMEIIIEFILIALTGANYISPGLVFGFFLLILHSWIELSMTAKCYYYNQAIIENCQQLQYYLNAGNYDDYLNILRISRDFQDSLILNKLLTKSDMIKIMNPFNFVEQLDFSPRKITIGQYLKF